MARRVSLPAADDLFRPTGAPEAVEEIGTERAPRPARRAARRTTQGDPETQGRPSGRVRHDEKVTVYLTASELTDLESARLRLRAEHGIAVDRGRLVREAVSLALADLEAQGEQSSLARRLMEP